MARLIYSAVTSLDGYVEDGDGNFDWSAPDQEVHTFVNDLERPVGTYLYGRRMYETMVHWETAHTLADQPAAEREFVKIWQAAEKIVYSKTLKGTDRRERRGGGYGNRCRSREGATGPVHHPQRGES